jgi:hypothetical protein
MADDFIAMVMVHRYVIGLMLRTPFLSCDTYIMGIPITPLYHRYLSPIKNNSFCATPVFGIFLRAELHAMIYVYTRYDMLAIVSRSKC